MNKREIILDFTSLLDVIMIILFFFILFSHIETEDAKLALQTSQDKYDSLSVEAEQKIEEENEKLAELEEKGKLADEKLREADLAGERQGQNVEGIIEFSENKNIKTILKIDNDSWIFEIYQENKLLSQINGTKSKKAQEVVNEFSDIISEYGYTNYSTILCEFLYNSNEPGTYAAYTTIKDMFNLLKNNYEHFFFSECDLSIFNN